MKQLLLDTHVFLWWLINDRRLKKDKDIVREISDPENDVFVSAATSWEISIKRALGKLKAPNDIDRIVEKKGFEKLPISLFHGDRAGDLPQIHKDPFDRMLIAQAQAEGLTIVTHDEIFEAYGARVLLVR